MIDNWDINIAQVDIEWMESERLGYEKCDTIESSIWSAWETLPRMGQIIIKYVHATFLIFHFHLQHIPSQDKTWWNWATYAMNTYITSKTVSKYILPLRIWSILLPSSFHSGIWRKQFSQHNNKEKWYNIKVRYARMWICKYESFFPFRHTSSFTIYIGEKTSLNIYQKIKIKFYLFKKNSKKSVFRIEAE